MPFHQQLLQYIVSGATTGAIYALVAVGFVLIYNVTGIINFAQGESAMLGALLTVLYRRELALPLPLALALTVLTVAAVGVGLYLLAVRPLGRRSGESGGAMTPIIITIGASIAIRGAALIVWGTDSYALPAFTRAEPFRIWGVMVRAQSLWVLGTTLVLVAALTLFLRTTIVGKAMRACAVNHLAARLMGIRHETMSLLSFALGAALGAAAGAVIAPITYATYDMGAMLGLKGFVAAVLGGLTATWGAVIGGVVLGILETLGAGLISSGAKDALAFGVLLAILFLRPSGLTGSRSPDQGGA